MALSILAGLSPQSAAAASHPLVSTENSHPRVMEHAAADVAAAATGSLEPFVAAPHLAPAGGGTSREVFGFALASSLADPTVGYSAWNFSLLSTVAFFGLHVSDDGTFAGDSGASVWNSSQLSGLLSAAHAAGTRVLLTIVLQDFSPGTPHMCAALARAPTVVAATVAEVHGKGVDGVNVDFEGLNGSCGATDPSWARNRFTYLMAGLRGNLGGYYVSVDTYAGSAADPAGFFDVGSLASTVDSMFVMAYDLEFSNYYHLPPGCVSFCLGPTAPLTGYYYNDTTTVQQYLSVVPASKVILGVPYYGRKGCVGSAAPNQAPNPSTLAADSYLDASGEATAPMVQPGSFATHRDANDPVGQERWDTWVNSSLGCTRELYWDDTVSLSQKYALVNQAGLRGVGIWNLNYGGGAPELWSTLRTYFSCQVGITISNPSNTTEFSLILSAPACSPAAFDVESMDTTLNLGWSPLRASTPVNGSSTAVVDGFPGYSYQFQVRTRSAGGITSKWVTASATLAGNASLAHVFRGLYTVDAYGAVHGASSEPLPESAYWSGWKIAVAAQALPGANPQSGLVLDGFGGLHGYGSPITGTGSAYWPGWAIARDFAFLPDGSGGYVLDGFGGLHPFAVNGHAMPAPAHGSAYWPGFDIARKLVIFADGSGGYVLDGYGGLHPFAIGTGPMPGPAGTTGYWGGWDIAHAVALIPGTRSGYVLDGFGGLHPFGGAPYVTGNAYWPGWDIARGVWMSAGAPPAHPSGYTLDGFGGLHTFGGAPPLTSSAYFPGQDIARVVTGF